MTPALYQLHEAVGEPPINSSGVTYSGVPSGPSRSCRRGMTCLPRQTEVEQHDTSVGSDQHVARLDIQAQRAGLVEGVRRTRQSAGAYGTVSSSLDMRASRTQAPR